MSHECTIVMYHYVRDTARSRYPDINALEKREFMYQLDYIAENYTFVGADDLVETVRGEASLPEDAVLLTFDDGFADHYETVYPILKQRGIQGCFFPPTKAIIEDIVLGVHKIHFVLATTDIDDLLTSVFDAIETYRGTYDIRSADSYYDELATESRFDPEEVVFVKRLLQHGLPEVPRTEVVDDLFTEHVDVSEPVLSRELYLTADQLRVMADGGMYIGSHGHEHDWLDRLSAEAAARDIDRSLSALKSLGVATEDWIMCCPYGAYDETTLDVLRDRGCAAAVTTEPRVADLDADPPLELPRLDTNDLPQAP